MKFTPLIHIIATCILLLTTSVASAKSIMLINSYHAEYLWTIECRSGFDQFIDPQHQITYLEMDTKRIPQTEYAQRVSEIMQKIEVAKPDLIVTMDDNALRYLGQNITDSGIPLVFMGVNNSPRNYFKNHLLPSNTAGVLERPLLKQNIALVSRLLQTRPGRILLMMDNGMTSNAIMESTLNDLKGVSIGGFTLDVALLNSYADWQAKIKSLSENNYDALIISNYGNLKDKTNQQVPIDSTSKWTSANSTIPVFGLWKNTVGKGKAIGGLILSGYEQGKQAAEIANKTLNTGTLPYHLVPKRGEYSFSQHELSRWNLSLPKSIKYRAKLLD